MLNANRLQSNAKFVIDRATHSIRFERAFSAPQRHVFEAWTQPDQIACWWDPSGERLAVCEIDLRPGGAFKFVMKAHPEMPFAGTYLEISPHHRLVFEALAATGRVLLQQAVGKTHMSVAIECQSDQHLDQFLQMGVEQGTSQTLDNLVTYLGGAV